MSAQLIQFPQQRHIPGDRAAASLKSIRIMFAFLETINYLCTENVEIMEKPLFELVLTDEARMFLKSLSKDIRAKFEYNIRRVQKGERDVQIFKKLENTEIWEFRTLYNNTSYRLFAFWDTEINTLVVATHGII